jgi:hypothetical protein
VLAGNQRLCESLLVSRESTPRPPTKKMTITNPTTARRRLFDFATAKNWDIDNSIDCVSEATEENGAYRMSLAFENGSDSLEFLVGTNGSITETGETA